MRFELKRYISSVLIVCLLNLFSGCYSLQPTTKDELLNTEDYPSVLIKKHNSESYLFDANNYTINNDTITGVSWQWLENKAKVNKSTREISLSDIDSIKISKIDAANTIVSVVLSAGLVVLIGYGIKALMESTTENIAAGIGQGLGEVLK